MTDLEKIPFLYKDIKLVKLVKEEDMSEADRDVALSQLEKEYQEFCKKQKNLEKDFQHFQRQLNLVGEKVKTLQYEFEDKLSDFDAEFFENWEEARSFQLENPVRRELGDFWKETYWLPSDYSCP